MEGVLVGKSSDSDRFHVRVPTKVRPQGAGKISKFKSRWGKIRESQDSVQELNRAKSEHLCSVLLATLLSVLNYQ